MTEALSFYACRKFSRNKIGTAKTGYYFLCKDGRWIPHAASYSLEQRGKSVATHISCIDNLNFTRRNNNSLRHILIATSYLRYFEFSKMQLLAIPPGYQYIMLHLFLRLGEKISNSNWCTLSHARKYSLRWLGWLNYCT